MAVNGVYVVLGETAAVVALLKKARRYFHASQQPTALEDTDPLLRSFADLKDVLNDVADLSDMNPLTYLSPFLDVIKSHNTNGPITEAALASVARFLNYGLVDANSIKAAHAVDSVAHAVSNTKFIGGANSGSDECVLFKILHVLRSLLLSPAGRLLSNEAVCDIMQSCFRICFEQHLSEMLRKAAEATLVDMTQLIFTRLPSFDEDTRHPYIRKLVMNAKGKGRKRRKQRDSKRDEVEEEGEEALPSPLPPHPVPDPATPEGDTCPAADQMGYDVVRPLTTDDKVDCVTVKDESPGVVEEERGEEADSESEGGGAVHTPLARHGGLQREVRTDSEAEDVSGKERAPPTEQMPYGLPCARELLRFLVALSNPLDRKNTESMVVLGLSLLTVSLEAAADHLAARSYLLPLISNELCRALLQLLDTEKLPIFAAASRCCFLLFESMRAHLKFQLETYFHKLKGIVVSEQTRVSYEQKEMALESIVQLWRIPGLVTELYLNYDCDLYCSNLFEELTKLLVECAFPVAGLQSTSLLSLDALLVVIDTIDQNAVCRQAGAMHITDTVGTNQLSLPVLSGYAQAQRIEEAKEGKREDEGKGRVLLRANRHSSDSLPALPQVLERKKRKRVFAEGTELFNNNPKKGIELLREKGLLGEGPTDLVAWLRGNPKLDKKKIADYICSRKHADVLQAFVRSFPFEGTRLDDALRMFLETFRLPGEAAEISMVMQHFSEQWYAANDEPFNHVDAAFTLSYAIIMLNTDQHNPQVRRNQPPMTVDCFKRNLSGTNGGQDFDPQMLVDMYNAIKSEEIVMPAEQTGAVKENYLWKVLLRRGETVEGVFVHAPAGWNDHQLFALAWGPAVAALSYVFDKSRNDTILQKTLNGYRKCASIAAHYGMSDVFDNLIIHLCKFSTLRTGHDGNTEDELEAERQRALTEAGVSQMPSEVAAVFGEDAKAQLAARTLFQLVHQHGDILKEGWKSVLDCLLHLLRARLLPQELTEVEDYVDSKGWVSIVRPLSSKHEPRSDSGLLSWFGLGGSEQQQKKRPSEEQQKAIKTAEQVVAECKPAHIITDSKYLTASALVEMVSAVTAASQTVVQSADAKAKGASGGQLKHEDEDALIFYLEMIIAISIENKDRLSLVWPSVRSHIEWLLSRRFGRNPMLVERAVVGLLRVANRNLFRDRDQVADDVLQSLSLLLRLPPAALFLFSRQIAYGLHELLRANAANVHLREHWAVLFALLEAAGAAVLPDDVEQPQPQTDERQVHSDTEASGRRGTGVSDRGYTSDDMERRRREYASTSDGDSAVGRGGGGGGGGSSEWIHLGHHDAHRATEDALRCLGGRGAVAAATSFARGSLVLRNNLGRHEPAAFLKVSETLAFLLRDAVHATPDNFESCVQCVRTFVEASLDGGQYAAGPLSGDAQNRMRSHTQHKTMGGKGLSTDVDEGGSEEVVEEKQLSASYLHVSLQLLDLCQQLQHRAPQMYAAWAREQQPDKAEACSRLVWSEVWRPLLQAIARLCTDCRRQVRAQALNHLVRAFLPCDAAVLSGGEWEACFGDALFPLLSKLLEPFSPMDPLGMEETRVRAIQLVAKTLLNHLTALSALPSFPALWLRLLDYMERYLRVEGGTELLAEAVPESLKNMLLVLSSTGAFSAIPGLHEMTVSRMGAVLPQLIKEVMPPQPESKSPTSTSSQMGSTLSLSGQQPSRPVMGGVQIAPASGSAPQSPHKMAAAVVQMAPAPVFSQQQPLPPQPVPVPEPAAQSVLPPQPVQQMQPVQPVQPVQAAQMPEMPMMSAYCVQSGAVSPATDTPPSAGVSMARPADHLYQPAPSTAAPAAPMQPAPQHYAQPYYHPQMTAEYAAYYAHMMQQQQQQQHMQQMQLSASNPLVPQPHPNVQLAASPNSAFTYVHDPSRVYPATHQTPYHHYQMPDQQGQPQQSGHEQQPQYDAHMYQQQQQSHERP